MPYQTTNRSKNSNKIYDESVAEFKLISKKQRNTGNIWVVYISADMKKNFRTGVDDPKHTKTWGWRHDEPDATNSTLLKMKNDDLFVFFGPTINTGKNAKDSNGKPNFKRLGLTGVARIQKIYEVPDDDTSTSKTIDGDLDVTGSTTLFRTTSALVNDKTIVTRAPIARAVKG